MNNRRTLKKIIAMTACTGILVGALTGSATVLALNADLGLLGASNALKKDSGFVLESATGSKMTVQEITEKVASSVVEISTQSVGYTMFGQPAMSESAGSGVIISSDGYIITNNHVVSGADKIFVSLGDKTQEEATLVGSSSTTDIAVLKINKTNLSSVSLGNSEELAIGQMAVVIGNPLGVLGGTVSAGIISSLNREVTVAEQTMSLVQTDASVNPGNSGGGLFDQYGHLVGIVVAKSSGSDVEGIGFAIPINSAISEAEKIIEKK